MTIDLQGIQPAPIVRNGTHASRPCSTGNARIRRARRLSWNPLLCLAITALAARPAQAQGPVEVVLHSFSNMPRGAHPVSVLTFGPSAELFGTTQVGGAGNAGVVFKLDSAGHQTLLHEFTGGPDGRAPHAGVIFDSAGNLYGTTSGGGTGGQGTIYRIDPAGNLRVLHKFAGPSDGSHPQSGLILDSSGNLYGTAINDGPGGEGTIYKLDPAGDFTVLHGFTGGADGGFPSGRVILDQAGNLYGTACNGGAAQAGVIFKLDPLDNYSVLHAFATDDGICPAAGLTLDSAGNLYGTTSYGPAGNSGTVFKLDTSGNFSLLYTFTGGADGGRPSADLILDPVGNLLGTTQDGGTGGHGVVFKLDPAGNETVLYSFSGRADAGDPAAGIIRDSAGNLYGSAAGHHSVLGALYKLDTAGHTSILYTFPYAFNGTSPNPVVADSAGNFFGTTNQGGSADLGVLFKLSAPTLAETVLYKFKPGPGGSQPYSPLYRDAAGNLYGFASYQSATECGLLFKLDTAGNYSVLHTFANAEGSCPAGSLAGDTAGNLYGAANRGGPSDSGSIFKLDAAGNFAVLHSFTGGLDGKSPYAGVVLDPDGNLYGSTPFGGAFSAGVFFKLDPAGNETVLYNFPANNHSSPGGLIRDAAGNLFGTTSSGGAAGAGSVFKLDPAGNFKVLHSFQYDSGGSRPESGLVRDPSGNFYGTTVQSTSGCGVVFKLDTARIYTVLHTFTCGADGAYPAGELIRGPSGNIFGVTSGGGNNSGGVVFMLQGAAP